MKNFHSICAREPENHTESTRPHVLPIYPTSAYDFASLEQGMAIFQGKEQGHIYGRFANPTVDVVAQKIADLETHGTEISARGYFLSSGMAAISTLVLSQLKPGDAILTQGNIYGGTTALFKNMFEPLGINTILVNLSDAAAVEQALRENAQIKMLYFETPSNPNLECVDIVLLTTIAQQHGVLTVADNTFCTPFLQQPLRYGVDVVIHSTTKFLNGHGNSIAGALISANESVLEKFFATMKVNGTTGNPWDAWLTHNGMKTLALRMTQHSRNAQFIAEQLQQHPKVDRVNYVGLSSHPDHSLAMQQMRMGGGILSFELKGESHEARLEAGKRFVNALQHCKLAPTLGDPDTLIMHPASMSHSSISRELRLANGIGDGLIRISVGIEDKGDIWGDLEQALGFSRD
ncbi:MAG: PLP-dependent aspartate aminotransferase family protein [Saprospiraceae bacterium]